MMGATAEARPVMMEVDDTGHLFHPHECNDGCAPNGCVVRPERRPGWYSPTGDEREHSVTCWRCFKRETWAWDGLCEPCVEEQVQAAIALVLTGGS